MDKVVFALEKIIALVTSQRFLVAVVSVGLVIIAVQAIAAAVFGFEPWNAPDEADLTAHIEAIVVQVATVLSALLAIAQVLKPLIPAITERPPTLNRNDYTR